MTKIDYKNLFLSKFTKSGAGFTMIELLVVMTLLIFIAGFAMLMTMDSYRGYSYRTELNTAVSVLQKARSQAINNINQQPHGVHIDTVNNQYVIFQGLPYSATAPTNVYIPFVTSNTNLQHIGLSEVSFSQLTGYAAVTGGNLTLKDATHSEVISLNNEGQISW